MATVFVSFSVLAMLIACLGLFSLAAYTAQRRTKEIGIRKVLGATTTSIVGLLSKDFMKPVAMGYIIAVPIAWNIMNWWLQDFAYRIKISPTLFLWVGALTFIISLATVSWQSIRAARSNPVNNLQNSF